ncbi:MAG: hypothetical protein JRI38_05365 [Deltaproteobacteria bacterium]|nr:hypothetical protein [Deltaproteobacteria bacterium]
MSDTFCFSGAFGIANAWPDRIKSQILCHFPIVFDQTVSLICSSKHHFGNHAADSEKNNKYKAPNSDFVQWLSVYVQIGLWTSLRPEDADFTSLFPNSTIHR